MDHLHSTPINQQAARALSSGSQNKRLQTIEDAMIVLADILTKPENIGIMRQVLESGHSYEIKIVGDPAHVTEKHHGFRIAMRTRIFMDKPRSCDFGHLT